MTRSSVMRKVSSLAAPDRGVRTLQISLDRFEPDLAEIASRVKNLRLMRGLSQTELAAKVGTTQTTISHFEKGRIRPSAQLVDNLGSAFGVSPEFLLAKLDLEPPTRPWLRAYAHASQREADARVAFAAIATEYVHRLELKPLLDRLPEAPLDAEDDEEIEELADAARQEARITSGSVVSNAIRAAERLGCLVLPTESELGRHLGMSVRSNSLPIICVAKQGIPGDRQRFTVCHELGHLILHGDQPPPATSEVATRMERQANRFAAAFLTPAEAIVESLDEFGGRVTLQTLAKVKAVWGVAIKSLVGRYRSLGLIDEDQARSLYKQLSARRWTKVEPVEVATEQAQWYAGSMIRRSGCASMMSAASRLAESIGGNADDVASFADWSAPKPADVLSLEARRRRG
jgi:Zn-dependent peptidase ImmA (M78 family)/DNA-binding XRE family transcriptional regulator